MAEVANAADVQTLDNFIGGRWVDSPGHRILRRPQSRGRRRHRPHAALDRRRRRRGRAGGRRRRFPPGATRRSTRARRCSTEFKALLRAAFRRDGPHRHHRTRQDARRSARQRAARDRVRRGGVRRAVADAGRRPRGHRGRHRLPCRAPAARRLRRDRAVQFSGDGADVVPAVRDRHRQHVRAEAVRAGAAVAAADDGAAAAMRICRPASSTSSTAAARS